MVRLFASTSVSYKILFKECKMCVNHLIIFTMIDDFWGGESHKIVKGYISFYLQWYYILFEL